MIADKKFNFAKSYQELQKIVEWFGKEEVDLEEGIEKFEEGTKIVKDLKEYLEKMENKIKELKKWYVFTFTLDIKRAIFNVGRLFGTRDCGR